MLGFNCKVNVWGFILLFYVKMIEYELVKSEPNTFFLVCFN